MKRERERKEKKVERYFSYSLRASLSMKMFSKRGEAYSKEHNIDNSVGLEVTVRLEVSWMSLTYLRLTLTMPKQRNMEVGLLSPC